MTIHKEGYKILISLFAILVIVILGSLLIWPEARNAHWALIIFSVCFYLLILQFFRNPSRQLKVNDQYVIAPADGKVVVIEEVEEVEVFKDRRRQISIFMSPLNVHINRNPIAGVVSYFKYHTGNYLVAWHPKASTENERTTIVLENKDHKVLVRQIAGALAKRIVWYLKVGKPVQQGEELGFIKFGSRVDVFVPLDAVVKVKIGDKTRGGETVLAEFL